MEGWVQFAFEDDCVADTTAVSIGAHRLLVVRSGGQFQLVDADCPHRGAHLAAGRRVGNVMVCPFHGYRIGLPGAAAADCDHGFMLREYPVLRAAGALFTCLSGSSDRGLAATLQHLLQDHVSAGRLAIEVDADPHWVGENAFDAVHFEHLHDILGVTDFRTHATPEGSLAGECRFQFSVVDRTRPEQPRRLQSVAYRCLAFAPGLILAYLGGDRPYAVLTGATPQANGRTMVRTTLALPRAQPESENMMRYFQEGLEKDRSVWESISRSAQSRFVPRDAAVLAFQDFCQGFVPKARLP